jgi:TonB family protein
MKRPNASAWFGSLVAAMLLATAAVHAQKANDLSAARDLYASAAYDEALTMLDRLRASNPSPTEGRTIDQYRAFCLLALGRSADAQQAIEAVVAAEPSYQPGQSDVPPRVRAMFSDARKRMLPSIIQQRYGQAKAAFDRKEWPAAASGFSQVLVMLADADVGLAANQPPLADIRTLAVGFEELASKAAAPPPAPAPIPAATVAVAPPPVPAPAPVIRVYSADDPGVVPPVAIAQTLPSFRGLSPIQRIGRIEVVIDETGAVESASMTASVTQSYDKLAVAAARAWRYQPATLNGTPVKFRKVVQITVKPTT